MDKEYIDKDYEALPEVKKYRRIKYVSEAVIAVAGIIMIAQLASLVFIRVGMTEGYNLNPRITLWQMLYIMILCIAIQIVSICIENKAIKHLTHLCDSYYARKMGISEERLKNVMNAMLEIEDPKLNRLSEDEFNKKAEQISEKYGLDRYTEGKADIIDERDIRS